MAERRGRSKAARPPEPVPRSARMEFPVALAVLVLAAPPLPYPTLQPPTGAIDPPTLSPPLAAPPPPPSPAPPPPPELSGASPVPLGAPDLGSSREATCRRRGAPVCGRDGRTYPNACEALRAGAGLLAPGACRGR